MTSEWVGKLVLGATLVAVGFAVFLVIGEIAIILRLGPRWMQVAGVLYTPLGVIGFWLMTAAPADAVPWLAKRRIAARVGILIGIPLQLESFGRVHGIWAYPPGMTTVLVRETAVVLGVASGLAQTYYLLALAQAIGPRWVAKVYKIFFWLGVVVLGLGTCVAVVRVLGLLAPKAAATQPVAPKKGPTLAGSIILAALWAAFLGVIGTVHLGLLFRLRRLKRELEAQPPVPTD